MKFEDSRWGFARRFPLEETGITRAIPVARPARKYLRWVLLLLGILPIIHFFPEVKGPVASTFRPADSTFLLPTFVDYYAPFRNFPAADTFRYSSIPLRVNYAADPRLEAKTLSILRQYRPDVAVVLVADLRTGGILAVGEKRDGQITSRPLYSFGRNFPAASLAKIVTALAAIETRGKTSTDEVVQLGSYYTLYRGQLHTRNPARAPHIPLQKAFSLSINPAFAMLGMEVGPEALRHYASVLGFNESPAPGILAPSRLVVPDSGYGLAEIACGFNRRTTISPLHALEIATLIGNGGRRQACSFSTDIQVLEGDEGVQASTRAAQPGLAPATVAELRKMMAATIATGTARRTFHRVFRGREMDQLVLGGKTGSLNGLDPAGRYDWFIGFAQRRDQPGEGLAVAVMQVHQRGCSIKSSGIAALLIRDWFTRG